MKNLFLFLVVGSIVFSSQTAFSQTKDPKPIAYKNLNKSVKAAWGSFQIYFSTSSEGLLIDASTQQWWQVPAGASFQGQSFSGLGTVYLVEVDTYTFFGGPSPFSIFAVFSNTGALVGWYPSCDLC